MIVTNPKQEYVSKEIFEPSYAKLAHLSYKHSKLVRLSEEFKSATGKESQDIANELSVVNASIAYLVRAFIDRNERDNDQ